LITPAVIPIIRDETKLFEFITNHQVDYLVTFPSWYPDMTQESNLTAVYRRTTTDDDNMTVYEVGKTNYEQKP
jgi:hypothetical protein